MQGTAEGKHVVSHNFLWGGNRIFYRHRTNLVGAGVGQLARQAPVATAYMPGRWA